MPTGNINNYNLIENVALGSVKTCWANALEAHKFFGDTPKYMKYSTLNEVLDINPDIKPNNTDTSRALYFMMGNKGHGSEVDPVDGVSMDIIIPHSSKDVTLYSAQPWAIRPVGDDLPQARQTDYALRAIVNIQGVNYIAYWALKNTNPIGDPYHKVVEVDENGKVLSREDLILKPEDMKPVPPTVTNTGVNATTGRFIETFRDITLKLTDEQRADALAASKIYYGHTRKAIISEIALVSAVEKVLPTPTGSGGTFQMKEAVAAIVTNFISSYVRLQTAQLNMDIAVGNTEPLFHLLP